jgi:hypothetical protein
VKKRRRQDETSKGAHRKIMTQLGQQTHGDCVSLLDWDGPSLAAAVERRKGCKPENAKLRHR